MSTSAALRIDEQASNFQKVEYVQVSEGGETDTSQFAATTASDASGSDAPSVRVRLVEPTAAQPTNVKFIPLQRWDGVVEAVNLKARTFDARLIDRSSGERGQEIARGIPFQEVDEDDHFLVGEGAVFYWSIGYREAKGEQRTRVSIIRFQRLPITEEEIELARSRVASLISLVRRIPAPLNPAIGQEESAKALHSSTLPMGRLLLPAPKVLRVNARPIGHHGFRKADGKKEKK